MAAYRVPAALAQFSEEIRGSNFITRCDYAANVAVAKKFIADLNAAEPTATHHCWAYIVGNPASTTLMACSDDGEPNGTAGMPMLNILQHSGLGDIVVVVTRYYGGTKLGKGGLARAYSGGVKQLLDSLATKAKIRTSAFELQHHYSEQARIDYLIQRSGAKIISEAFQAEIVRRLEIASADLEALLNELKLIPNTRTRNHRDLD